MLAILKTLRDIFDTTRLIIQARRNGFRGGFILMSDEDYKAMQADRDEASNNSQLMWNAIVDMARGASACDYCMFDDTRPDGSGLACFKRNNRGCQDWCLRDLTEEERLCGIKEPKRKVHHEGTN